MKEGQRHPYVLGLTYHWMRVSSGKELDSENPAYDAGGIGLQLSRSF